jgi:SecD/SecF fusion protein
MQNKGLVRVFAIVFAIVSIFQLTYTFITNKVETDAENYANSIVNSKAPNVNSLREEAVKKYLDSIGEKDLWGGFTTYDIAKNKELRKGLDLKGGINVILQISVKDLLIGMADGSNDPSFRKALAAADERVKDGQKAYVDYFFEEFSNIKGAKLASPDIFAHQDMVGRIEAGMTNSSVEPKLREELQASMTSAFQVLRKRIDKFGTTQPNIQQLGNSGRILIELPGAKDITSIKQAVTQTAQLEFWHVFKAEEVFPYIQATNELWIQKLSTATTNFTATDSTTTESTLVATNTIDGLLNTNEQDATPAVEVANATNPLRILALGNAEGPVVATFNAADKDLVMGYLNDTQARAALSTELRNVKFVWGLPIKNKELGYDLVDLYAIKSNRDAEAPLGGAVITDARQDYSPTGGVVVSMSMNSEGAKTWEKMTTEAFQNGTQIAVVLDNTVYSAPGITNGPISGGNSQISGSFTVAEADDLANVLRAGKLPASAEIIQSDVVGPSLGQEAIDSGLWSFAIALLIVLLWMIFYYGRAGIYADIALMVNLLFMFGALASLQTVLTLPGIAGIVLTIGMSVDANVLIFERIKEELAKGKSQADSIRDGFNNALSSILDSNVTTFLTAAVLFFFGTGPIQGFATTLMIGIATSLFTAIFITRLFVDGYVGNGRTLSLSSGVTKNWFTNVNIDFLKKRKIAYVVSGIMLAASLTSLLTSGLNQGIDFTGGRTYTVRFAQDMNATDITKKLSTPAVFTSAEAKTSGGANQLKISTKYRINDDEKKANADIEAKLYVVLKPYLPAAMSQEQFANVSAEGKEYGIMSEFQVGPTIADDILVGSIYAILGSLLIVFLYILIRFRKWQFSLGAVAAVFHDVVIVLGIFSAFHRFLPFNMEVDQAFIAAILTVIGYSLNDTVIVFDRIREFINERLGDNYAEMINAAISSTLSRTVNTSLTTLLVLIAIFSFGGESIRGFMFAMIVGVGVGTYSSVFIATPLMYDTLNKSKENLESLQVGEELVEA